MNLVLILLIKFLTKISGAEAPEDIPIVVQFSILSKGTMLSACISLELTQPDCWATSINLTELEELIKRDQNLTISKINEVEIVKENIVFKVPGKLN